MYKKMCLPYEASENENKLLLCWYAMEGRSKWKCWHTKDPIPTSGRSSILQNTVINWVCRGQWLEVTACMPKMALSYKWIARCCAISFWTIKNSSMSLYIPMSENYLQGAHATLLTWILEDKCRCTHWQHLHTMHHDGICVPHSHLHQFHNVFHCSQASIHICNKINQWIHKHKSVFSYISKSVCDVKVKVL